MKLAQIITRVAPDASALAPLAAVSPQLVWVFGSARLITAAGLLSALRQALPGALLAGCSTAGEISDHGVGDDRLVLGAMHFDDPDLRLAVTDLQAMEDSHAAGARLAAQLAPAGAGPAQRPPVHDVIVLGQGVHINGSALIDGLRSGLPEAVRVSGGLAADGGAFVQTHTLSSHAVSSRQIVALGFASPRTRLQHGSLHGWKPFGPLRQVTRAQGNVLYELDGEPALNVYRRYLGEYASGLPGTGLLFPFEMVDAQDSGPRLIRTILGIDADAGSLILAGDILAGGSLRLMHASIDSLVDGAQAAAEQTAERAEAEAGERLALLISCVGRKLVLGARADEEVEAVASVLGAGCQRLGFYSNGEISPDRQGVGCSLHNQTMTITLISERPA